MIDKIITDLFYKLINNPDKIINVRNSEIYFGEVTLTVFRKNQDEAFKPTKPLQFNDITKYSRLNWCEFNEEIPDTDKYVFYINTPYRQYTVPEITDRIEYAKVLNQIDKLLSDFENRKLTEYLEQY